MNLPKIYVVAQRIGDRYHLWRIDLCRWFFFLKDAENWIALQSNPSDYAIEEVEGEDP